MNYSFSTEMKLNLKDYKYEQNSVPDLKELYNIAIILREIIMINTYTFFSLQFQKGLHMQKFIWSLKHPCKKIRTLFS